MTAGRRRAPEPLVAINLVDPEIPPEEDPEGRRVDVGATLEARKALAEAAQKEGRPHGLPGLVRSLHKLWNPHVDTSDIRAPTEDEVEVVSATREDGQKVFNCCCTCGHYHHGEGQRLLTVGEMLEAIRASLGQRGVDRLGDLRQYGYCGARDTLTHQFGPMCGDYVDGRKILGKLVGGAVGAWRRIGGI